MGELRQARIDGPAERADAPVGQADGSAAVDTAGGEVVDRRRTIAVQKEFLRETADREPESGAGVPHSIDWTTGEPADDRTPAPDHADTPDEVTGVGDPLAATRPYDRWGGLSRPDQRDQWSLEHVVPRDADGRPEKYPSPKGEWIEYVNDGGPDTDPLRGNNCLDCSMAAISTYHGHPTVAAPRTLDINPATRYVDTSTGEADGPERAQQWLECQYETLGLGDGGFSTIEQKLREGGPGSSAAIINSWTPETGGGAHAWNAFNDNGDIVWYDPQRALTSDQPVHRGARVEALWAACLDPEGKQL